MTDIAKLAIETDTSGLTKGAAALKNFQKVGDSTATSVIRNTNGMANGFKTVLAPIKSFGQESSKVMGDLSRFSLRTENSVRHNTNGMAQGFTTVRAPIKKFGQESTKVLQELSGFTQQAESSITRNTNGMANGFKTVLAPIKSFGQESKKALDDVSLSELELAKNQTNLSATTAKLTETSAALTKTNTLLEKETNDTTRASLLSKKATQEQAIATLRLNEAQLKQKISAGSVSAATEKAAESAKKFGNRARGVSLQLSQVAQQGSVTGNFLQAFAIQLPDLLLGFGTLGILIGAAAGALAVPLVNALKGSSSAVDELVKSIREGEIAVESLSDAQARSFARKQAKEIEETTKNVDKYKKELKDASSQVQLMGDLEERARRIRAAGYNFPVIARSNKALEEQAENIDTITIKLEAENKKLQEQKSLLEQVANQRSRDTQNEIDSQADERLANIQAQQESLEKAQRTQLETVRDTAMEEKAILANSYSENIIDLEEYRQRRKLVDEKFAQDSLIATQRESAQRNQILTAGQQASLSIIGGLFGQMAAIAQQGGEKQFQAYKNLATAQALISTSLAVANTLANPLIPPPLNFGLAAAVGTLGAIQVGMIQNQQYQGTRAMGGQVEAGGRFLVGENGPEILQLGSQSGSITPNHAIEGGGGPTVTTIVNIQAGVTKAEVVSLIPDIVRASVNGVKSEIARGGTMAKAVGAR